MSRQLVIAREELAARERELERHARGSFPHLYRQMRLVDTRGIIEWLEAYRAGLTGQSLAESISKPLIARPPMEEPECSR